MAPNFLTKLVSKNTSSQHSKERSERSSETARPSSLPSTRNRALSAAATTESVPQQSTPSIIIPKQNDRTPSFIPTIQTSDTESTHGPSVTVVPPSPLTYNPDLSSSSSNQNLFPDRSDRQSQSDHTTPARSRTTSSPTSFAGSDKQKSPPQVTKSSSPTQLKATLATPSTPSVNGNSADNSMPSNTLQTPKEVRHQTSNKSLKNMSPINTTSHIRSATTPVPVQTSEQGQEVTILGLMSPIVESPTTLTNGRQHPKPPTPDTATLNNTFSQLGAPRDSDAVSIASSNGQVNGQSKDKDKEKKRPWRRATAARKPTGLASAIAASGMAMANPTMSAAHQSSFVPPAAIQPTNSNNSKKGSTPGSPPYMSRSPTTSSVHTRHGSADFSPRSSRSKRSTASPRRRTSVSVHSDNNSEYFGDDRAGYYSGLGEVSSDDANSDSTDDSIALDLGEDDIPVTGFAVASNKRNADFHELFPAIPEGDYLIEDYGCALQREILIQGRIYISENHICFHANIFGWITDLSIPIYEIKTLEKKMTAFVIPNAIQITTRQAKYTFASFLSRDTTFDVIYNIWRLARPTDNTSISSSPRESLEGASIDQIASAASTGAVSSMNGVMKAVQRAAAKKTTICACGREGKHFSETALETVVPGTPDRIHNLVFASGFIKDFLAVNQKLLDLQMSDWSPIEPGSKLLTRNMSYIKPLNGSLGPKQTKCEIKDETAYVDFDDYVSTVTTTRTPDVPSGGVFSVKTRTCIMWASAVSTKIVVTTQVDWTGRSFIKGIIERSAIDGQKVYHADLEKAMRLYIQQHQSEFIPEGLDVSVIALAEPELIPATAGAAVAAQAAGPTEEEERKKREHERNRRGLQWAYDTFDGAYSVAKQSTKGALELIRDGWDQSSPTTILYFVIVGLVFSNLWTLMRVGGKEEVVRRREIRKEKERERWVEQVVTTIWDELAAKKEVMAGVVGQGELPPLQPTTVAGLVDWRKEVAALIKALDDVEARAASIRGRLTAVHTMNELD